MNSSTSSFYVAPFGCRGLPSQHESVLSCLRRHVAGRAHHPRAALAEVPGEAEINDHHVPGPAGCKMGLSNQSRVFRFVSLRAWWFQPGFPLAALMGLSAVAMSMHTNKLKRKLSKNI